MPRHIGKGARRPAYHEAFLKGLQKGGVSWLHLERAGVGRSGSKSLSRGIFEESTERRRALAAFRKGWGGEARAQILITKHF